MESNEENVDKQEEVLHEEDLPETVEETVDTKSTEEESDISPVMDFSEEVDEPLAEQGAMVDDFTSTEELLMVSE